MSRNVYIAGPMTGMRNFNYPAFDEAQQRLELLGYTVFNPTEHGAGKDWTWYLRQDVAMVLKADAICLLPGWEASRGARLEVHVAHALGMLTLPVDHWTNQTLGGYLSLNYEQQPTTSD